MINEKIVMEANANFYKAFNARDLDAMKQIWSSYENVTCVQPGWSTLNGFEAIIKTIKICNGKLFVNWLNIRPILMDNYTKESDKNQLDSSTIEGLEKALKDSLKGQIVADVKVGYQLSGGMQQRVALARGLINDPDLILMDEPLGALDALTREKMQSLVLKIWKETGKTIILITHSVEEALLLGERVYVMAPRPGRIHKEYKLPFALMGLKGDLREIKNDKEFVSKREEILSMIWNMEEEIMGKDI